MIRSKYTWKIDPVNEEKTAEVARELDVAPSLARMLVKRKVTTSGQLDKFLHPTKYEGYDPFLLAEMDQAVARIKQAIEQGERILIYGDYDADGVTSIAVLTTALRKLGAEPDFYIPNRFTEGYGPNQTAFQMAKDEGFDLIITVDNGIAALEVMTFAKEIGLDVIVTDHHEAREVMPEAVAVIHPKHPDSNYPFTDLAGVGVSYKLAHALLGVEPVELLDLVAVGTVADLVSLNDENRLFVQKGLMQLREKPNLGLQALAKKASVKLAEATEETIGFALAPRLNAVGRLGAADPAADLLLSEDPEEAGYLAEEIDQANKERREIVKNITEEAVQMIEELPEVPRILVLAKEGWNPGVLGIVASRVVEKYGRPTICLSIDQETGLVKGSGRSIAAFHLYQELDQNRSLLTAFGGHPMAAGLTLEKSHLETLTANLNQQAEKLSLEDFRSSQEVEAELALAEVTLPFIQMIEQMAPFGFGNPKPVFLFKAVKPQDPKRIGADKTHLKTVFAAQETQIDAIGFGLGFLAEKLSPTAQVDVIGELSINEWNNMRKAQIRILDLAVAHWQLFDVRNRTEWSKIIQEQAPNRFYVCYHEETIQKIPADDTQILTPQEAADLASQAVEELVFADMPTDTQSVETLVEKVQPDRLYFHFGATENIDLEVLPDRKEFAALYKLIKQYEPFSLAKYGPGLTQKFGWKKEQIDFMSNVFFELEFATIDSGVIKINPTEAKRSLDESASYQERARQIATRQKLLYSNYFDLYDWMKRIMET
ncbi:single-stranded-DNA-specific exonuclease RecJ [Listeria costaricensis]|uniref:single-stranded-DNA-specific exonuclease RecJ n=1 Tax=Listeria costaricensis TaxID=2026604 RepID=UPI000C06B6C5|nr:single-stranded-DNA-specific exonuclease RecJ [Listeria costaricensis]